MNHQIFRARRALTLLLALFAGAYAFAAQDDATFLAAHGFPASGFTVLWQWEELPPSGDGRLVTGYSLQPNGTAARLDIYRLGDDILSDVQRTVLGIREKRWDVAVEAPADTNVAPALPAPPKVRPDGIDLKARIETLALPPFTPKSLNVPDAFGPKANKRIGDKRPLVAPITLNGETPSLGAWLPLSGDRWVWRFALLSPGATGQRIHVASATLPPDACLLVYNPAQPDEAFAYTGPQDAWLPTVFNEEVIVEVSVADATSRAKVQVEIDETIHIYAPLTTFQKVNPGTCNLDAACYPDWADTALGVCGLGVVSDDGAIFCTGTLLADTDPCTTIPYVLTAHHCVGGQGGAYGASNLEFYWTYQTPACNGTPPSIASVPRTTGGAAYLGGNGGTGNVGGGNDFTLLRMNGSPPVGATYVGWTSLVPDLGTEVTDIHHPRGSFKRISFGDLTNVDNPFSTDFIEVTWNAGTTEPGSSGSALLRTDTAQVIGQLWGGGASCVNLSSPDYFGRFSKTYVAMQAYLDPVPIAAQFQGSTLSANESDTSVTITVALSRPAPAGGLSVDYAATSGTAIAGLDFTPVNGTLNFSSGAATRTFNIPLLQDFHADEGVTIMLALSAQSCGTVSATLGSATLVINDDDSDTDGDGVSDYDELNGVFGPVTDPSNADSDGDGLNDYAELLDIYGYDTDPNDADTDDDEIPDWFELVNGTDPTVPDTIGLSSLAIPWFTVR